MVAVCAVTMLALVILTYPGRLRHLPPRRRRSLFCLRILASLALVFAMLRPAIQFSEIDSEPAQLVVLMDRSRSMSTPDGPAGLSRRDAVLQVLEGSQELLETASDEIDVRYFDFAEELMPVEVREPVSDGNLTAIGKVLDALREQERGERLLAVILASDGAQRAGGEDDIDPLTAARRFAEQRGVPVHTIVFGTSALSTSGMDLAVEDLSLDQPVTFERKTVPVQLQVRMLGAAGRKAKVRLLIEDRTGKALGESGELIELPLSADARPFRQIETRENMVTVPVELSFVAEQAGEYKIAAEVVPQDGEVKLGNNRLETLITVRKGGLKVAYFDVPRPEQKFLRRLNETAKIQLDTQVILPGSRLQQTRVDPTLFDAGMYDVYLIGDVPASVFKHPSQDLLGQLAARVQEGAGLAMIGGLHNFGAGGYADTPLKALLPVRMSISETIRWEQDAPQNHHTKPIRMLPTPEGELHYLMRLSATNDWRELPEMGGANRLSAKSGAVEILSESASGDPLLFASDTGGGRVLALGVDETWKWHLHGFEAEHQRFWQQFVLWLARKEFDSDQPVWVRVEPRNFAPLSRVSIEFGAQDDDGNPIADAVYHVEVITPEGENQKVPARRFADHGVAEFSETLQPGDYWIRVNATRNGESLGSPAMSRFIVNARDLELDNPAADPGLMSEIAAMTGGTVIPSEGFHQFLEQLITEGIPTDMQTFRRINLWDGWPMLCLFVLLMSLEWTIRKLNGLV